MADGPSRDQNKFIVRMPDGLRDRIRNVAEASSRSMNAEIVHRLELSLIEDDLVIIDENAPPPLDPREHATRLAATFVHALRFGMKSRSFKDPDDLKIFIADLLCNYHLPLETPSSEGSVLVNLSKPMADRLLAEAQNNGREPEEEARARLEASFSPSVAKAMKKEDAFAEELHIHREEMRLLREELKSLDATIARADRILSEEMAKKAK